MMKSTQQIALSLFLIDKNNKKAFEAELKLFNNYLASLNPNLTDTEKLRLLIS